MKKESMYGNKIRTIRTLRGFSQEFMSEKLGIDPSKYSRIENNSQKLTAELLDKISSLLGVSTADIVSPEPLVIQNTASNLGTQGIGHIEHFYSDQKEVYEKLIETQKEEILRLTKQNEQLMRMLEKNK